ncbi:hypothetical protein [Limnohabitans sp.]|uniref:hypothetical protein n=1 Tax=Limnohabitans sp. TaxID=1907725 RepID=UPI00286F20FE|nr:hypothetical protein [Limnohabitans sp.]
MSADVQMKEHVKEVLHDGTLYLGYVSEGNGCDGCHFQRPMLCMRPLAGPKFFCGGRSNNGKEIIWVAEVTA